MEFGERNIFGLQIENHWNILMDFQVGNGLWFNHNILQASLWHPRRKRIKFDAVDEHFIQLANLKL